MLPLLHAAATIRGLPEMQHHTPGSVQSSGKPRVSSAAPPPGNGLCVHSRGLMLKGLTGRVNDQSNSGEQHEMQNSSKYALRARSSACTGPGRRSRVPHCARENPAPSSLNGMHEASFLFLAKERAEPLPHLVELGHKIRLRLIDVPLVDIRHIGVHALSDQPI